jgi:hypothetical protein
VALLAEYLHEVLERRVKAILRLEGFELRNARLRTDDQPQRRNHVDDELGIGMDGCVNRFAPRGNLVFALGEQLLHKVLQRGDERAERNVLLQ